MATHFFTVGNQQMGFQAESSFCPRGKLGLSVCTGTQEQEPAGTGLLIHVQPPGLHWLLNHKTTVHALQQKDH